MLVCHIKQGSRRTGNKDLVGWTPDDPGTATRNVVAVEVNGPSSLQCFSSKDVSPLAAARQNPAKTYGNKTGKKKKRDPKKKKKKKDPKRTKKNTKKKKKEKKTKKKKRTSNGLRDQSGWAISRLHRVTGVGRPLRPRLCRWVLI